MAVGNILSTIVRQLPANNRASLLLNAVKDVVQQNSYAVDDVQPLGDLYEVLEQDGSVQSEEVERCRQSLLYFFLCIIRSSSDNTTTLTSLSFVLQRVRSLEDALVSLLMFRLEREALQVSYFTLEGVISAENQALIDTWEGREKPYGFTMDFIDCPTILRYLEVSLCTEGEDRLPLNKASIFPLVVLVLSSEQNISTPAAQIVLSYIFQTNNSEHASYLINNAKFLWHIIRHTVTDPAQSSKQRNSGLAIWLRFASVKWFKEGMMSWLDQEDYYNIIAEYLADGTSEQQKVALATLRASILIKIPFAKAENDAIEQQVAQYTRFTTVYETVVLVGYLNQIEDCLKDLSALSTPNSTVHSSWIMTLLRAAFNLKFQNSVRKIVAGWVLRHAPSILSESGTSGVSFLRHSFLAWASTGALYASSTFKAADLSIHNRHGELVAGFIEEILERSVSQNDQASQMLKAILMYLKDQGKHISSYARVYILEGALRGIRTTNLCLDQAHIALLRDILSFDDFSVVARDYMIALIWHMLPYSGNNVLTQGHMAVIENKFRRVELQAQIRKLQTRGSTTNGLHPTSVLEHEIGSSGIRETLASIYQLIKASDQAFFNRISDLQPKLSITSEVFRDHENTQIDSTTLLVSVHNIYEWIQKEHYPRRATMEFTDLILHPTVVILDDENHDLFDFFQMALSQLYSLQASRIYIFAALARAWHKLTIQAPTASSVLSFEAFVHNVTRNPPIAKVEFNTEVIFGNKLQKLIAGLSYESYYGPQERTSYAHVLIMIANTRNEMALYRRLFDNILDPWVSLTDSTPIFVSWKSTTQLQILVILAEHVLPPLSLAEKRSHFTKFLRTISLEQNPRYRYLFEWLISRLLYHLPQDRQLLLEEQSKLSLDNPKFTVSLIRLTYTVAQLPDTDEAYATQLSTQLTVLATSVRISIRHEAHWTVPKLWDLATARHWRSITDNAAFKMLNHWIRSLDVFKEPPAYRHLDGFHPIHDHNLTHLIQGKYLETEPKELPKCRHEDLKSVINRTETETNAPYPPLILPLGNPRTPPPTRPASPVPSSPNPPPALSPTMTTPLQTKSTTDPLTPATRPTPLIVIASLLTYGHNLGGVSRCTELLGAAALYVPDPSITSQRDFKAVSVSSHLHIPIHELRSCDVRCFLRAKRAQGWEVVGIEQTDDSRILGDRDPATGELTARFRRDGKTVLVLGSEREGIPADLLAEMEWCVEVRQRGTTRSMNVQTAAGVVMWEWGRQWEENGKGSA